VFTAAQVRRPDERGRILISGRLLDYAGIDSGVLAAGLHTHLELWNLNAWQATLDLSDPEQRSRCLL
jgi:DNA-binding transcriptional regulator/RsmH inhibitor MraZ